jgi:hypothetical protein
VKAGFISKAELDNWMDKNKLVRNIRKKSKIMLKIGT